jgi:hypothetical protein
MTKAKKIVKLKRPKIKLLKKSSLKKMRSQKRLRINKRKRKRSKIYRLQAKNPVRLSDCL